MGTGDFTRYVTEDRILGILLKERAKWLGERRQVGRDRSRVYADLCSMLPSRRTWVTPGKNRRSRLTNDRTRRLRDAETALRLTLARDRAAIPRPPYFDRLGEFISGIRSAVRSGGITLARPATTAIYKDREELDDRVVVTFRPISVYDDLRTKVLLKLATDYLTALLDPLFHEEILSYRRRRDYHGEHPREKYVTTAGDAVTNILQFRREHPEVWVAECDIRKFYDIVDHREVMKALGRLLDEGGIDRERAGGAIAILEAYLDSYSFRDSVLEVSRREGFWDPYVRGLARTIRAGRKKVECRFGWVDESELPGDLSRIGIPQGGVPSTLICNILMNDVDRSVVDPSDRDRLFNRFGDDIILMHASEEGCRRLFGAYKDSLAAHGLVYHPEKSVSDFKDGTRLLPGYWDEKTKAPFRWGPGEGNAADWIGFVGYEIRSNGEVRLRKSTLAKQFDRICFRYNRIKHLDEPIRTGIPTLMQGLDRIGWSILKFDRLDFNPSSRRQMHLLDRYRHNKAAKALRHLSTLPVINGDREVKAPAKKPSSFASVLASRKDRKKGR